MADIKNNANLRSTPRDIFVSHSKKDEVIVRKIVTGLNQADITTFCSTFDQMPSTHDYDRDIDDQIDACTLVLGLQSENAVQSPYVHVEWADAWEQQKLIFIRLEELTTNLRKMFRRSHYEDFSNWNGSYESTEWIRIIEAIKRELKERKEGEKRELIAGSTRKLTRELKENISKHDQGSDNNLDPDKSKRQAVSIISTNYNATPFSVNFGSSGVETPIQIEHAENRKKYSEKLLDKPTARINISVSTEQWGCADVTKILSSAFKTVSFDEIHLAARAAQADAQALVGLAHLAGAGGAPLDPGAAKRWLERAADAGHPRAKVELAILLASGPADGRNIELIDSLTSQAADNGCTRAFTTRALLFLSGTRLPGVSYEQVSKLLTKASDAGDDMATTHLGWGLLQGVGMQKDTERGFELLRSASQAGYPRAMAFLGIAYLSGRHVRQDWSKAANWFEKSARQNDSIGHFYMAWCAETGVGVARDAVEARRLYQIAADQGEVNACVRLARMLLDGRGGIVDPQRAVILLEKASNDDNDDAEIEAKVMLAEVLEEGNGVPRNLDRAVSLYQEAEREDNPVALWRLAALYESGRGVKADREHAVSLYNRAARNAPDRQFLRTVIRQLQSLGVPLTGFLQ